MAKARKLQRGDPGYVGRDHPPKQHQFKKGVSGNPAGRPPGRRSSRDLFLDELFKPLLLGDGTYAPYEALLASSVRKQVNMAKHMKPVEFSLRLMELLEPASREDSELVSENKRNLIDASLARLAARRDGEPLNVPSDDVGDGDDDDDEGKHG